MKSAFIRLLQCGSESFHCSKAHAAVVQLAAMFSPFALMPCARARSQGLRPSSAVWEK
eukprot:CAMPEP_0204521292 /NCGR_PEP_ID=MMETSP0661-20131031/5706_1 /ASSEMBLY_ACC=CAM_ASM_000606 /TAXON_ID=109239 /ORGANISM="Alexandrium margalefi, Strain AMGDE01CS-322" /LENGTH=57 /DNA_ID=CAMNT_0051526877 /DNA_START=164 /DNA_END=337 /DNA_ORIENTATION=-